MVGHSTTEAAIANMFGHKTEQLGDIWSKRDATSCNLSTNSTVDTTSISHATIHLQDKKQHSSPAAVSVCLSHGHTNTSSHTCALRPRPSDRSVDMFFIAF